MQECGPSATQEVALVETVVNRPSFTRKKKGHYRPSKKHHHSLKYKEGSIEQRMVDEYFPNTKALAISSNNETQIALREDNRQRELVQWLDPSLRDSAQRMLIYGQLKAKVVALEEEKKRQEDKNSEEEEKIRHERWLRKLEVKQSIT